jgi:hypothetical protein
MILLQRWISAPRSERFHGRGHALAVRTIEKHLPAMRGIRQTPQGVPGTWCSSVAQSCDLSDFLGLQLRLYNICRSASGKQRRFQIMRGKERSLLRRGSDGGYQLPA